MPRGTDSDDSNHKTVRQVSPAQPVLSATPAGGRAEPGPSVPVPVPVPVQSPRPAPEPAAQPAPEPASEPSATPVEAVEAVAAVIKPKLRGWFHAGTFPLALAAGIVLICLTRTAGTAAACAVFAVSSWLLFGVSGVYHRGTWGPKWQAILRRLDHTNIFLIIAGTYTPLAVVLLTRSQAVLLLVPVWAGALIGIGMRVFWLGAPRWVYVPCYLALGWAAVFYLPDFLHRGGVTVLTLVVVGGLLYSVGAVVYGLKRPNPAPRWFGFHEIFHVLTIAAFTCHYVAISISVYAHGRA
jgi:hemolysin III